MASALDSSSTKWIIQSKSTHDWNETAVYLQKEESNLNG